MFDNLAQGLTCRLALAVIASNFSVLKQQGVLLIFFPGSFSDLFVSKCTFGVGKVCLITWLKACAPPAFALFASNFSVLKQQEVLLIFSRAPYLTFSVQNAPFGVRT